ncbi:MAG: response regulator [Anaerolineales bacterium]|nr:response regulator [Anaerolineales bacterium]
MIRVLGILRSDPGENEVRLSIFRNLVATVGAVYLVWHFLATLSWPHVFSPSLWFSTMLMFVTVVLALRLAANYYPVAQTVWFVGLSVMILQAYTTYRRPEVMLLWIFLPLMAVAMLGYRGTFLVSFLIVAAVAALSRFSFIPPLPEGYRTAIIVGGIFSGSLSWSISSNLISAIDSASFHFKEARRLLEETRQHRAEISRMLKDRNQINYQLERLNQMLQAARNHAEEARADRDRFVLAISHELRSPLNFILGFSDLMVNSPETYADLESWPVGLYDDVQEIYRSSTHLLGLINDILDIGQIDAQRMSIFREKVGLCQIVEDVQNMVEKAFTQKGLYLRISLAEDLPPMFVDRTRIRQVLLNLVNNSLRFTEHGGVTITARQDQDAILVQVTDTGAGIASEDFPKIFEEFRQVGVDQWQRSSGSGLGLSISRRFVQLHGGKMWLESTLGQGTSIFFTIPINQTTEDWESSTLTPAQDQRFAPQHLEKLVLLCSANPMAGKMSQQWLESYHIQAIDSIAQLPDRVRQTFPQAVLVDRALEQDRSLLARELPYPLPLVSFHLPGNISREQQLPAGVSDYLVKPISRQALLESVQRLGLQGRTLLVVEDDPAMARFILQAFRSAEQNAQIPVEYQVLSAYTGEEALNLLQERTVDALLLDLELPDMHGWELLEHIRQLPCPFPPVIVISAMDLPQELFSHGQVVLDVTLNRPLSQVELPGILKALVENIHPAYPRQTSLGS